MLGRRAADDMHEIRTILQTVTLHDSLTFTLSGGTDIELFCTASDIPVDERNLVHKAATMLRDHAGIKSGVRINLEKHIPAAGGLGGGSSDAAITLLGLSHLWNLGISKVELARLAARLGADVPFFFTGGTALGTGTGTDILPLDDAEMEHLLIITPHVTVATAEAYNALSAPALTKVDPTTILPVSHGDAGETTVNQHVLHNDFEPVIFRLQPSIKQATSRLLELGARSAGLSGSGSSVFGIFGSRAEQERAANVLIAEGSNWRIFPCATLAREQYKKALGFCAALL